MNGNIRIRPHAGLEAGTAVILREDRVIWAGQIQRSLDNYRSGDLLCLGEADFEPVRLAVLTIKSLALPQSEDPS